jgi:hypothetical protein
MYTSVEEVLPTAGTDPNPIDSEMGIPRCKDPPPNPTGAFSLMVTVRNVLGPKITLPGLTVTLLTVTPVPG